MKCIATVLALAGLALAVPAPQDDPIRILPSFWEFNITSLKGPGCPDFNDPNPSGYSTRTTYGQNTVDGSEIYYWHVAYPYLRASVGAGEQAQTWCETTLQYSELDSYADRMPIADYRLKLHKNGTRLIAVYDLEEDVTAEWKFTYYPEDEDEVIDTITINGPRDPSGDTDLSVPNPARWALPACGSGTIKFRTDLFLSSEGGKGEVFSTRYGTGEDVQYYGSQQGFSYDWEKCAK